MGRSSSVIEHEAKEIGTSANTGLAADNACIQVLAALVEELAECVQHLEREVESLKRQ